ncbi:hypothetical protein HPB50_000167 [Hyalomma asiaticum]|uniref:Uncharacterized protein n=1 Tax=Hyalomma asiaticum TaxID=266040 RepID=A0ACB7TA13_HYAAI|nr:hypothetical protein HPB50_000167 [Hyalomma asiaticum]
MGITGLSKVIADNAPDAIKESDIKSYFGRKIAIDASMCLYQFLIAVRQENNMLTNSEGETTSHLVGFFYRTIRMIENGIKPVYVFDGKPPGMKSSELEKRQERREAAEKELEKAEEAGNQEEINKFSKRLVKVTRQHGEDCKKLLALMGVPYIEKNANQEFNLEKVLSGLQMNRDEFIDLCILLGCDYCESIRGIGPKRAVELIKQHKCIEKIISSIDTKKYTVPEDWPYKEARQLFLEPEVTPADDVQLKWSDPDEEGLVKFLCEENGFRTRQQMKPPKRKQRQLLEKVESSRRANDATSETSNLDNHY